MEPTTASATTSEAPHAPPLPTDTDVTEDSGVHATVTEPGTGTGTGTGSDPDPDPSAGVGAGAVSTAPPVRDPFEAGLSKPVLHALAMADLKSHFAAFPSPAASSATSLMIKYRDPTGWDEPTKRALLKSKSSAFWKQLFDAGHAPDTA